MVNVREIRKLVCPQNWSMSESRATLPLTHSTVALFASIFISHSATILTSYPPTNPLRMSKDEQIALSNR